MLDVIKNNLIVSCQALEDEPLHSAFIMGRMAKAAKEGGAVAIRAQGVDDIIEIKRVTNLPVIGIIKRNYKDSEVFITPTEKEIKELIETGCEMIALDATDRTRPNNEKIKDLLELIHKSKRLAMADVSTYEEGIKAQEMGFDCISTTLSGYTSYSTQSDKVDFKILEELVKDCSIPVICEGRIYTPEELKEAFDIGAYSVVIGGAITRPQQITERFVKAIK